MDYVKRSEELVKQMTLDEKVLLCSGLDFWHTKPIERLDLPSVMMTDGPHGMRKEDPNDKTVGMKKSIPATCFPPACTCASTWNTDLLGKMGACIADEARDQEVITVLGPGINIKRSPKGGRNFEYYSEDPYLAGRLAAAYIQGVQGKGIGTSLKHFAVNSQEYLRMSISEVVDERTFREIYLPAFEYAVKEAQPATVMCSYNRINGTFASENKYLLTDILRDEWGYKGIVVSDWGATNQREKGVAAGLDLEMPSSMGYGENRIHAALKEGTLQEEELDVIVRRMVQYILRYSQEITPDFQYDYEISHAVARKVGAEGAVLLKNEGILPLAKGKKIALIGALAKESRYQGAGSSLIVPKHLVHLPQVLEQVGQPYQYAAGYSFKGDGYDEKLFQEAVEVAKANETVLLFVGLTSNYESEGFDRQNLKIPASHEKLVQAICQANPNVAVVLVGGAPVEMDWADQPKAILNAYLAGEAAGEIYYDLVWGDVNPSGKLAETYPIKAEDYLGDRYFGQGPATVEHREALFVGYRYFDAAGKAVRYPFGYGLSYTTFAYDELTVDKAQLFDDEMLRVSCRITNTGKVAGSEVVQLYVQDDQSTPFRPKKELKGFAKVFLQAGESKVVEFALDRRSFAYYNVQQKDWTVESGTFTIQIGASSRDIRLQQQVTVQERHPIQHVDTRDTTPCYYDLASVQEIPDEQYTALYGRELPPNVPQQKGEFDVCSTVRDLKSCHFGRMFASLGTKLLRSTVKDGDMTTMICLEAGFLDVPVRNFVGMSSGIVTHKMAEGIILRCNGHFFKGWAYILGGIPHAIRMATCPPKKDKQNKKVKRK